MVVAAAARTPRFVGISLAFVFLLGNPIEQQQAKSEITMENRELLTAFSDLVLCVASIWSVQLSSRLTVVEEQHHLIPRIGFGVLAVASGLGCIRFSVLMPQYHSSIIKCHLYFAFLGSSVGKERRYHKCCILNEIVIMQNNTTGVLRRRINMMFVGQCC